MHHNAETTLPNSKYMALVPFRYHTPDAVTHDKHLSGTDSVLATLNRIQICSYTPTGRIGHIFYIV
jgi:hypothetical protein